MNAEQLKASILQQAIEGKLVPHLVGEGTVEQIGDAPEDVPFAIPEKWKWFTLGSVIEYGKCNQLAGNEISSETWVLDLEDIEKNTGRILDKKRGVSTTSNKNKFEEGFVLYSKLRPYLNKVVIADESGVCTTEIVPIDVANAKVPLLAKYLQCYLMSPLFLNHANQTSYGVKMPRLGTKDARAALIPIPPVEEQSRIVTRIEELLPLVEAYGKSYARLQELNAELPGKLKASILQEAIQGKLVPQLDSEEAVEQIGDAPKDVPFAIPEKWKWVTLSELVPNIVDCPHSTPKYSLEETQYLAIDTNCITPVGVIKSWRYVTEEIYKQRISRLEPQKNDIIYTREGSIGRAARLPDGAKVCMGQRVMLIRPGAHLEPSYLQWYLMSHCALSYLTAKQRGIGVKHINVSDVKKLPIPVPSLQEQRRIVDKVRELLESVDALSRK